MPDQTLPKAERRYQSLSELKNFPAERKYQDSIRPRYQERMYLNERQYRLYKHAMYGLSIYTPKQLELMTFQKKRRICKLYKRVHRCLNLWKQDLVNQIFEQLCSIQLTKFPQNPFNTVFKDTRIGVKNFNRAGDNTFICNITFEQLKIGRDQIIQKLVQENVLPANFYELI